MFYVLPANPLHRFPGPTLPPSWPLGAGLGHATAWPLPHLYFVRAVATSVPLLPLASSLRCLCVSITFHHYFTATFYRFASTLPLLLPPFHHDVASTVSTAHQHYLLCYCFTTTSPLLWHGLTTTSPLLWRGLTTTSPLLWHGLSTTSPLLHVCFATTSSLLRLYLCTAAPLLHLCFCSRLSVPLLHLFPEIHCSFTSALPRGAHLFSCAASPLLRLCVAVCAAPPCIEPLSRLALVVLCARLVASRVSRGMPTVGFARRPERPEARPRRISPTTPHRPCCWSPLLRLFFDTASPKATVERPQATAE